MMNMFRQYTSGPQYSAQYAQQQYLQHSALTDHYERLRMASAGNSVEYYRYAELQYYHKSRAFHFKAHFSAVH